MLRELRKKLKGILREAYDVIVFGSSVKGKLFPGDVDIAVIVDNKKKHKISDRLTELEGKYDIEVVSPEDLEQNPLLAMTLFHEGISLKFGDFRKKLGIKSYVLFTYSLSGMRKSTKNRFLRAMKMKKEVIRIAPSVVIVPVEKSSDFEEFLNCWNVSYRKIPVFIPQPYLQTLRSPMMTVPRKSINKA